MADIKISELEPTTDLEGLYTIGSDKNNLSKKVSLQFLKDAANYANEQGDYAKQAGDTVNGNVGVSDYPEFSASKSYVIGDIVRYNGVLYAFTANHAASAWNGSDVKATSINAITSGKLTELESQIEGTILGPGTSNYKLLQGHEYRLENVGGTGFNIGYIDNAGTYTKIGYLASGDVLIFTATIESVIDISKISGVKCVVYDLSDSIGGQFANFVEQTESNFNSANNKISVLDKETFGISIVAGKEISFDTKIGNVYFIENTGSAGVNLYYRDSNGNAGLISNLAIGQIYKYEPTNNASSLYISNISGAKAAIYEVGSIGYNVAQLRYNNTKIQDSVELQLVGISLAAGDNSFPMTKGKTYVFVNEGVGANMGYKVNAESEYVSMGNIVEGGILTFKANEDSSIIDLSRIGGVAVRGYVKSNLTGLREDEPIILKTCSFNLGDFTGEGFDTPSEDGKLTYRKLLGKIGANLIGTQEDVELYGQTTSGGKGDESVKDAIFPMYKNYFRQGTGAYNYKGFATDYNIINIEKVYYIGDFYFTHPWFLKGILNVNGKQILVLSFHWEWRDTETRQAQIAQMIEYAESYDYVIALGDTNSLNAKDGEYIEEDLYQYGVDWQKFKDAGYDMANNGNFGLFMTSHGGSPIDNIFVKGGKIKNAYIIQEEWMRDHYPIIADVVI